jgi:multidrug resistance efflux pump
MIRRIEWLLALSLAAGGAQAGVLVSGEVRAQDAESIITPPSDSSPVVLRFFVPEGTAVKAGDVLVRIDPGASLTQIRQLDAQIEQARAKAAKELAELQVKAIDAEKALVDARAARDKARVDAAIPRAHLSALDFDRYRGELDRAEREHGLKEKEFRAAGEAVARRRADGGLEVRKLEADRLYHQAQVANAEQRASMDGVVLHGFDNMRGGRFDEGSTAFPGNKIGDVVGAGGMTVRAYVLEPDRGAMREGQRVALSFDALPGSTAEGRVARIAGAPEPKAEWGEGRYFTVDIDLVGAGAIALRPGMSVRVALDAAAAETAR